MVAKQFINTNIPSLFYSDTVERALDLLNDYKLYSLPLVKDNSFEGFLSEDTLLAYDYSLKLSEIPPILATQLIYAEDPLLEAIRKAIETETDLLAVVDSVSQDFQGVLEKAVLFEKFIGTLSLSDVGGLIEINIKRKDYSLAEITRIIENESARIISLFITNDDHNDLIISLKLDVSHLSAVVNTLIRFGYDVVSYHSSEPVNNIEKDRYELLMKYLNM